MGVVYYANYLVWFEIGRVELLRSLGLAYSQMEKDHKRFDFSQWWSRTAGIGRRRGDDDY